MHYISSQSAWNLCLNVQTHRCLAGLNSPLVNYRPQGVHVKVVKGELPSFLVVMSTMATLQSTYLSISFFQLDQYTNEINWLMREFSTCANNLCSNTYHLYMTTFVTCNQFFTSYLQSIVFFFLSHKPCEKWLQALLALFTKLHIDHAMAV